MIRCTSILLVLSGPAIADTVVAARTIPARSIIAAGDLLVRDVDIAGAVADPQMIVGKEARVALYAGRPIRAGDISAPAVVERNQHIEMIYFGESLTIRAEGLALERAGPGDRIRVMNTSSRSTVMARIGQDGNAYVGQ